MKGRDFTAKFLLVFAKQTSYTEHTDPSYTIPIFGKQGLQTSELPGKAGTIGCGKNFGSACRSRGPDCYTGRSS